MNKHCVILTSIFLFSLSVNANSSDDANNKYHEDIIFEEALSPEKIADSIVFIVPSKSMDLHIPKSTERIIKGEITKVEKGREPNLIILSPNTFTAPLTEGIPKKIYLKQFTDRDAYYPIAIYPVSYIFPAD